MDWGYKATLTMMTVAVVLLVAQIIGRRIAGIVAGLPVITAPALIWVAADQGAAFAAEAAVGSIAASGSLAIFALVYERLSRSFGPTVTLISSLTVLATAALATLLLASWADQSMLTLALAAMLCSAALARLPSGARATRAVRPQGGVLLTSATAGSISVGVALGAHELGPFLAGLLASLPIISGAVLVNQHLTAAPADIQRFLRGYVTGLLGKAFFAFVFAISVMQIGAILATGIALAIGLLVSLSITHGLVAINRRSAIV